MSILVIVEHNNKKLAKATLHTIAAAKKISSEIDLLVFGRDCTNVVEEAAKISGVQKILVADDVIYENFLAENIANLIITITKNYTHILASATSTGKDFLPRVAALIDSSQISEIIEVIAPDTFKRPIYAGNAIETVQSKDAIKIITVRQTAFEAVDSSGGNATIEKLLPISDSGLCEFIAKDENKSDRVELTSARVVVSGGRGIGSKENFAIIEQLANKFGAAIGASRGAVDAGYISNDAQVGQTGKIVAPELYIAVGISGQIQHIAGMKDSKIIVAINKDENAPIFEVADYGLVGDLFQIVPELISTI